MVMPSGPKRAVTVAPLPSRSDFEIQIADTRGGIDEGAGDAGVFGGGIEVRDGIQRGFGKLDLADGDETDGEAVHAIADVALAAIGGGRLRG